MYFPPLVWDDFYQCLQLIFLSSLASCCKMQLWTFSILFFLFHPAAVTARQISSISLQFQQHWGRQGGGKKEGGRETEDDTGRWGVAALTLSSTFKWDFSQTQETGKSNLEPEEPAHHVLWISRGDVLQSLDCGLFASCSLPCCLIFVSAVRTKNFPSPAEVVLL